MEETLTELFFDSDSDSLSISGDRLWATLLDISGSIEFTTCHPPKVISNKAKLQHARKGFYGKERLIKNLSKFMEHMSLHELHKIAEIICDNPNVERLINSKIIIENGKYYKSALGELFYIYEEIYGGCDLYYMGQSKENIHKFDKQGRSSSEDYFDWLIEEVTQGEYEKQQIDEYSNHHGSFMSMHETLEKIEETRLDRDIENKFSKSRFKSRNDWC